MRFKFTKCNEFIILEDVDKSVCYIAISPVCNNNSFDGLYLYHGCKHDQIETDENGHLKIMGIDDL